MPVVISGTNGVTFPDSSLQAAAASPYGLKNRIINGDMRIDQRNAGTSVAVPAASTTFFTDRWSILENTDGSVTAQQSTTAPTGFSNSLLVTVTSDDPSLTTTQQTIIRQPIEGFNTADLSFGTANAQTVTLSFWVRSSVTGTFSGSFRNSASDRSYPFTYTILAANTWEKETITIAGDTSGTWIGATNGTGLQVIFSLGAGPDRTGTANAWAGANLVSATGSTNLMATNGATFYITGVQLEIGTSATPFERRLYNQELANCQRYYYTIGGENVYNYAGIGMSYTTTAMYGVTVPFPVNMRAVPTFSYSALGNWYFDNGAGTGLTPTAISQDAQEGSSKTGNIRGTVASGFTAGRAVAMAANNTTSARLNWSAEL
jgi:hypothetical protein